MLLKDDRSRPRNHPLDRPVGRPWNTPRTHRSGATSSSWSWSSLVLVGGTWLTVKFTTDHLLYQNATRTAQNWAQYLAANVSDLERIAAGETPSSASTAFFKANRKSGEVFRYTIFNRYGYSILVADRDKVTPVDLSEYSVAAAKAIKEDRSIVDAKVGQGPDKPAYFSEAYVPVRVAAGQSPLSRPM